MNLQKVIIFSTLFLDIIGIAIIIPAFPELKAYYGIGDFQVTLGLTVYSLFAFLSAPLLGQLSDKFGRKRPLLFCVLGTLLSYLVLLVTQQYRIFIISRAINGITGGNVSILQAILTDISPTPELKNKNYALMGAIFGVGFIIGPVIGALLLKFGGIPFVFGFGALFALVELVLIIMHFSNTNIPDRLKELSYNTFTIMRKYVSKPDLRNFFISLFFLGIGAFIINASQSLYMNTLFGTTGVQYGYFLGFAGVISALNLGVLYPKFWSKQFSDKSLILLFHAVLIIGYAVLGSVSSFSVFAPLFYFIMLFSAFYMPVYNREIMSKAKPNEIGELSGMLGGAQSLFMFFGPLIGGILLHYHFNIFYGAVICIIISIAVMLRFIVARE